MDSQNRQRYSEKVNSEYVYRLVCALYWKADMNKDEIVEYLGYQILRHYKHISLSGDTYSMSSKDAVSKIIHCEILAHTQAKILITQL